MNKLRISEDQITCIPNYGFFPLQIAYLYKIFNSVNIASATENLLFAAVSVVSDIILNYPWLYIGGFFLPCPVQYPIISPIYQRLSHGVAYLYGLQIHFLLS